MNPRDWLKHGLFFVYEESSQSHTPSWFDSRANMILGPYKSQDNSITTLSVISLENNTATIKEEENETKIDLIEHDEKNKSSFFTWLINLTTLKHENRGFRYVIDPNVKTDDIVEIVDREHRVIGYETLDTQIGKLDAWILECKWNHTVLQTEFKHHDIYKYEKSSGLLLEIKSNWTIKSQFQPDKPDDEGHSTVFLKSTNFRFFETKIKQSDSYETLKNFENKIRQFIVEKLSDISNNWWNERIPDDVRANALDRKTKNEKLWPWKDTKETELIHYVDFNDYSKIIKKRDNWRDVFKDYFINDEMISSKLLELEPIRNSIGHSRELTSEEKQILELYTRQILRCII